MTKRKIHLEDITIYALSINVPDFIKQTLLNIKEHIGPNTIIVGHFSISLSLMDGFPDSLPNNIIDQVDITDMYRTTTEYTLFSAHHETFSKIDVLGYKASLKWNEIRN